MDEEIIQIMPSPSNMWVRWNQEDAPYEFSRVVCLALVRDEDGFTYVAPMVCMEDTGDIENCHFFSNFEGIVFSENPYEDYKDG